jgi:hypothetical protein
MESEQNRCGEVEGCEDDKPEENKAKDVHLLAEVILVRAEKALLVGLMRIGESGIGGIR